MSYRTPLSSKIEITFSIDMLWTDSSEDDYDVDATESNYLSAVENELFRYGYDVTCNFSNVSSMKIEHEDGEELAAEEEEHMRNIIDNIEADYIELDS